MESYSESYKKAGVDVTAGYKAVALMKSHIARTMTQNVLTDIGGFGGLYALDVAGMQQPVLVSGTDGVGTKPLDVKVMVVAQYIHDDMRSRTTVEDIAQDVQ